MDERRLLVAFSLSLLVLVAFQVLSPHQRRKAADVPPRPVAAPAGAATSGAAGDASAAATATARSAAVELVADEQERRVDVETRDAIVGFTNRGARVVSWRLTQFRDAHGRPEEMVQTTNGGSPLDLETGDTKLDDQIRGALFKASAGQLAVAAGEEKSLRFEYASGDLAVEKVLTFSGTGYLVGVQASVKKGGVEIPKKVAWGPGLGNPTEAERSVRGYEEPGGAALVGPNVELVAAAKLKDGARYGDCRWLGVNGRYFAAVWVGANGHGAGELRQAPVPATAAGDARVGVSALLSLAATDKALLFVGPKEYRQLVALDHELARIVPVGDWWFFRQIVVGFMDLLRWLHARIHNYGWSVICLTVLINVLMSPLRHYGLANGVKMAKLSPEMKVIQERYRKYSALDPKKQEMQKEIAALYERHGMSMGTQMTVGCLPMLLTMPFLFAIWRVLSISIDLRGASFLWIPDLSQADPLYVMPFLMAGSMFISQRTMPSSMDPAQQRMMMVMPLVFVAFCFAAPGGLNLYWFASNVCTILQQTVTLRILKSREAAGKERRKK